jgi:sensor histidine kinase YesM
LDVAARGQVTELSILAVVGLGLALAARIGVALFAVEREAQERRAAEHQAAVARLRAVTAQMNPHFLFNALHSLSALVRRDPRASEDVLERLGGLLRYGLDHGEHPVTLAEEWAFADNYVSLEKVRLGDRLTLIADIDPSAVGHTVPPFVLQPLVENAVRHGIDRSAEGGRIEVSARVEGDELRVRVWDSGRGADPEQLAQSKGVGLRGVRAQLQTHFGSRASLTSERPAGGGFAVSIAVPIVHD